MKTENPKKHSKSVVSIAVTPFDNLTGDVEQDYFSRGFVEDLITDLSRFSNLQIISSHSSLNATTQNADEEETARGFGADFLLKGNLRRLQNTLRINTQLVDPYHGHVLWAERYDAPLDAVFEIHDNIVEQVVGALSIQIDSSLLSQARQKSETQLHAYDYWLRGFEYLRQGTLKDDEQARQLFQQALKIDPHYARAYAGLSLSYFNEWSCQLWESWDENEQNAYEYALMANKFDDRDHVVQMVLGRILLFRREYEKAECYINAALELNPNDADNLVQLSSSKVYLGDAVKGIDLYQKAIKLNPNHGDWYYFFGSMPFFTLKKYDQMIDIASKISPVFSVDLSAYLAAAYAYCGDMQKAEYYLSLYHKTFVEKITYGREPEPGEPFRWVTHVNPYKIESDMQHFIEGLTRAGLSQTGDKVAIDTQKQTAKNADQNLPQNCFRKQNTLWELCFANVTVQIPEVKGLIDIANLLSRQNEEIHCSELMGTTISFDDGEEMIDSKARGEYFQRIKDLQEELDEAESMNDTGRCEILQSELDQITDHLEKSTGLGGKTRKLGSVSEKARTAVTWRIRSAIRKIEIAHPKLAKHLSNSLQTGTFCSYRPEDELHWNL